MRLKIMVVCLLFLGGAGHSFFAAEETLPATITCCDEQKIRLAMTEEVLARILAKTDPGLGGNRFGGDYLSEQAYDKIKKHLPGGASPDQRLAFLRQLLRQPPLDRDIAEFQTLVGHFVLGMTLEIGNTFQDEYDLAMDCQEKTAKLIAELEKHSLLGEEELRRALFNAEVSDKEMRRLRTLEIKWKDAAAGATSWEEFNSLKKNVTGRAADPDQQLVFALSESHRGQFPFLSEFLENYRRLGDAFRDIVRRLNALLANISN